MFSIGKRIGFGYLLMALLLAGIGAAGVLATNRISDSLNRITGPVEATVRPGFDAEGMLVEHDLTDEVRTLEPTVVDLVGHARAAFDRPGRVDGRGFVRVEEPAVEAGDGDEPERQALPDPTPRDRLPIGERQPVWECVRDVAAAYPGVAQTLA